VVGILGMDVLKQTDIELDAAHRKMNLFSPDHCPGHVVYWAAKYDSAPIRFRKLGEFYFPMELDGKKLETTLATSRPMTTLRTDATWHLFHFDTNSVMAGCCWGRGTDRMGRGAGRRPGDTWNSAGRSKIARGGWRWFEWSELPTPWFKSFETLVRMGFRPDA
jgi:hypothetical protein